MSGQYIIELLPQDAGSNAFAVFAGVDEMTADLQIRESNHRIKNSLQLVASLLASQGRGARDTDTRDEFSKAALQIQAIARLHEQLQACGPETVDAAALIAQICADLSQAARLEARRVVISLYAEPMLLPADEARMLGMVVTELVTNGLKHAYATCAGEIHIELTNGTLLRRLRVRNASLSPAAPHSEHGQGTRLVQELARRLGGIAVRSNQDGNHTVTLSF
jgi:two-component sensor histidine kinase